MFDAQPHKNRLSTSADTRERIAEIGEILALGLQRLWARKSSELSGRTGESSLDFVAQESGAVLRNGEGDRA